MVTLQKYLPHVKETVPTFFSVVPTLSGFLWDSLLDLDDLTSSTHSVMELLANLVSSPEGNLASSYSSL